MVIDIMCWTILIVIIVSSAMQMLYCIGMAIYFYYELKDGKAKRYTEEQRKEDEEQIQSIKEMNARKEEKRKKRQQRRNNRKWR